MALVDTDLFHDGTVLRFGFESSAAPTITGFHAHTAELRFSPEVFAQAQDGEGHTLAVAVSKPAARMVEATFTGYVANTFSGTVLGSDFNFIGRFFIIRNISEPRKKGEFAEVTIEAVSYANVDQAS